MEAEGGGRRAAEPARGESRFRHFECRQGAEAGPLGRGRRNVEMEAWVASLEVKEAKPKEAVDAGKEREAALASERDKLATRVATLVAEGKEKVDSGKEREAALASEHGDQGRVARGGSSRQNGGSCRVQGRRDGARHTLTSGHPPEYISFRCDIS